MIRVNGIEVKTKHFPDNTQFFNFDWRQYMNYTDMSFMISWCYENDEECMILWYLVHHIREKTLGSKISLELMYVPNARMDRTKKNDEVFTLKYFSKFINSLNFEKVYVLDPHSNVTPALIDNCVVHDVSHLISLALTMAECDIINKDNSTENNLIIYFPDSGAMKRYSDLSYFKDKTIIFGKKKRDWSTGDIIGDIEIYNSDEHKIELSEDAINTNEIFGKNVLMVDDIISYGGTFAKSADKLKKLGVNRIYAYATHCENSVLDKNNSKLLPMLESGIIEKIYTTNSIFSKNDETEFVETVRYIRNY